MSSAAPSVSPSVQVLIDQGIAAVRQQDLARAFDLLTSAIRLAPEHEQAWLWLSGAVADECERKFCLQRVLAINPSNAAASRGLGLLKPDTAAVSPLRPQPTQPAASPLAAAPHASRSPDTQTPGPQTPAPTPPASKPLPAPAKAPLALPPATTAASRNLPSQAPVASSPRRVRRPSLLSWSTLGVTVFGVLYALMYLAIAPNGTLGMIIVLGSSGWVYVDATKHGLRRGMGQGLADMSPGGWFGACLLLWIIAFPMYLIKRSELITRAAAYYGGTPIGRLPAQKSSGWSCLATALLFTILGIVGLGILSLLSAPTSRTTFVAAGAPPAEAPPAEVPAQTAPEVVSPAYTVQKIETSWTVTSRGFTELDGQLWVPEVRATIRNTGDTPTEELYLRAVFYDQDKVIKGDPSIESLESIPAGFAKGPVFLHGSVGYTNDFALLMMGEQPQQMWNYELSIGTSYFGPWETIEKGVVELPPGYRPVKQDPGPSASADKPQAL